MSADPYQVLGVAKDAAQDEIRKAYRNLAKELHPDLNPGNAHAAERFKEIAAAHALLRDPDKRARFDRGEIDAAGAERPQEGFYRDHADADDRHSYHSSAGFEDFEDLSDVFADLLRREHRPGSGGSRARGQDLRYRLEVTFLDAATGTSTRVTLPDGQTLELTIPEGIADGQQLRLSGKGTPGVSDGPPGDALVEISVRAHPFFERRGDDIVLELPITIDEAVLGGKVEAPTVTGRVALTIPKGASTGQILRLRGKGIQAPGGKGRGDQLVTLKVVLPPAVDDELTDFMQVWRQQHAYDPRAAMKERS